jgi:hypothetical protein
MVKKFKSRYGDERILTLLEDGSYKIEGRSLYTRHGDGLFDFEGGPCYIVGDRLLEVDGNLIIKSVKSAETAQENWAAVIVTTRERKNNVKVSKKLNHKDK